MARDGSVRSRRGGPAKQVVRTSVEAQEAFGIVHVGPVRIRIEPLEPRP
jgi:hypothetical protein